MRTVPQLWQPSPSLLWGVPSRVVGAPRYTPATCELPQQLQSRPAMMACLAGNSVFFCPKVMRKFASSSNRLNKVWLSCTSCLVQSQLAKFLTRCLESDFSQTTEPHDHDRLEGCFGIVCGSLSCLYATLLQGKTV